METSMNLYKFFWEFRRFGIIEGLFIANYSDIPFDKELFFGEALGKHSEISGTLKYEDITLISEDKDFIDRFITIVGDFGYNPIEYEMEEDE